MKKEYQGARLFLNIPAEVAHDPRFKSDKSILLFGEIYSMLNVTGEFFMSNKQIAKRIRAKSLRTVNNCLNELEKLGYIKREIVKDPKTNATIGRKITSPYAMNYMAPLHSATGMSYSPVQGGTVTHYKQIEHINRTTNRTDINIKNSAAKAAPSIPYKEIIEYLNNKTNQHLHYTTKSYQKLIKALWNKGYKLQDFKTVIDNQAFSWQGTKFWKYMRPSTLFRASKFDEYLNANNLDSRQSELQGGGYGSSASILNANNEGPF